MITVTTYAGKQVGVFGLGKTGEAVVRALEAGGAKVWVWDDRKIDNPEYNAQHFEDWPWKQLSALVLSPGVPLTHPKPHAVVEMARRFGCPVIGDIELLFQTCPRACYVGITGTNGKSTTTTLIGHILQYAKMVVQVGGNLGTPALALEPLARDGAYVLELSSYQLDLLETARFNVAVLLNITPDHLDRHGDMAGYIAAKKHLFERQQATDVAVIAVDDEITEALAEELNAGRRMVPVSAMREVASDIWVKDGILHDGMLRFSLGTIATLTGQHNWQNAVAAYAACRALGVPADVIYAAMRSFPGLRHRLQLVAEIKDVRFINDSKATNAEATANALKPYENIYWILGGKAKDGGIAALEPLFSKVHRAYLIGDAAEAFAKTLKGKVDVVQCGKLDVAVQQAARDAFKEKRKEAVVLLSPACASFDQFKSFEERGDVFCDLVAEVANGI